MLSIVVPGAATPEGGGCNACVSAMLPRMQFASTDPFLEYCADPYFCELTTPRPGNTDAADIVRARIGAIGLDALRARAAAAENDLINLGITFTVYSDASAIDRIL